MKEAKLIKKCEECLSDAEIKTYPVNLDLLGSFHGVTGIEKVALKESGRLLVKDNGEYVIQVNKNHPEAKRRFTIAHEIGHILVEDAITESIVDTSVGNFNKNDETEYLCDVAAANLLMPASFFGDYVKGKRYCFDLVTKTAKAFNSSLEAVALNLVKRSSRTRAVIVWELAHKPKEESSLATMSFPGFEEFRPQKQLRIVYGVGGSFHLPRHKSLEESNGLIQKALDVGFLQEGEQQLIIGENVLSGYFQTFQTIPGRLLTLVQVAK